MSPRAGARPPPAARTTRLPRAALAAALLEVALATLLPASAAAVATTGSATASPAVTQPSRVAASLQEPAAMPDAELDQLTAEVADQLRCPVCRNQSVLESSSELARSMQEVIRQRLADGESPDEVKAYFVARYGDWILLQPRPRGVNLLVYLLPGLAVAIGGWFVWTRFRAWRAAASEPARRAASANAAPAIDDGLDDEDREWLNDAIRTG